MGKLVIFEGLSGSGKTTLFTPVHKARKYEDLHIHRFTATHWVYAQLYDRAVDLVELRKLEVVLQQLSPTLVVWCRPNPEVAKERTAEKGDTNVLDMDFHQADEHFAKYLGGWSHMIHLEYLSLGAYDHVLELDTRRLDVEECVRQITEALDAI